jgi:hypothetical protein
MKGVQDTLGACPHLVEDMMKLRWREVIGAVMLAAGAWAVLAINAISPLAFCAAGFLSILGLTILLWCLSERLPYRPRPQSLNRQDELKNIFRGYPR